MMESLYNGWIKLMIIVWVVTIIVFIPISLFVGITAVNRELKETTEKNSKLKEALDEIIRTKTDLIRIIPEKYRYPLATNFLTEIFESGRADTMKEALNFYEEQLHRWKMEGKMEKLVKEQQRNNKSLWSYIVIDSFFR